MRQFRRVQLFIGLAVVMAIIVAACGGGDPTATPRPTATPQATSAPVPTATPVPPPTAARRGGTFTIANRGSMNGLDPVTSALPANIRWAAPMYSRLVTLDEDKNILPLLASSWTVSDDGTAYTFNLRDDVKFHDGQPLTAADVVYTWNTMIDPPPGVPSLRQSLFKAVINDIVAVDSKTVRISTVGIIGWFLGHVPIVGILPKHAHELVVADGGFTDTGMGSGPFTFVEFKPKQIMKLQANPSYFDGGLPPMDEIEWPFIFEAEAMIAAMITGRLLHSGSTPLNLEEVDAIRGGRGDIQVFRAARGITVGIGFNHENLDLANPRIREALVLALVEDDLIAIGYPGGVFPDSFFPGRFGIPESEFDDFAMFGLGLSRDERLAKAKSILEEVGATDLKFLWVSRAKSGHLKIGEGAQDLLKRIGVEIELRALADQASLNAFTQSEPFDIVTFWGGVTPFGEAEHFLSALWASSAKDFRKSGRRPSEWSNARIDELLTELRVTLDVAKRAAITQEADRILLKDAPSKQFGFLMITDAVHASVRGLRAAQLADPVWMLTDVSLEG